MNLQQLVYKAHSNAVEHGFWQRQRSNGHYLMMVITEVAEAVNADRNNKYANRNRYEEDGEDTEAFVNNIKNTVEDEMADIAIRLADLTGVIISQGFDLNKIEFLKTKWFFKKYTFTENAYKFIAALCSDKIKTEYRVIYALNYIFQWAKAMDIDLWYFINLKMRYNIHRPFLHGKKY